MISNRAAASAALLAALAVTGSLAADGRGSEDAPIEMVADRLDLDVAARSAVLAGHVKLTRGTLSVSCPRVDVRYDQIPHVTWLKGTGGVVAEVSGVKAEAPEAELDLASQTLKLRGGVRLTRGDGWISAEQATVEITTSKISMTEVRGSIPIPRSSAPKPAPSP